MESREFRHNKRDREGTAQDSQRNLERGGPLFVTARAARHGARGFAPCPTATPPLIPELDSLGQR